MCTEDVEPCRSTAVQMFMNHINSVVWHLYRHGTLYNICNKYNAYMYKQVFNYFFYIYNVYIFSLYIYTYKFRNKLFIEIRIYNIYIYMYANKYNMLIYCTASLIWILYLKITFPVLCFQCYMSCYMFPVRLIICD